MTNKQYITRKFKYQNRKEYRKNNPKKYSSLDKVFIFFGYITLISIFYKLIVLISPK